MSSRETSSGGAAGSAGRRCRREERRRRLAELRRFTGGVSGKLLPAAAIIEVLETALRPGDRVAVEGNNQKQADFLSRSLASVDADRVHDLHLLMSSISRPEHLDLFEDGIASYCDFAYAGPQSTRVAQLLAEGQLRTGSVHTYLELYARLYLDLIPDVALVAAERADAAGNLYTGPNTEDTPAITEATAFRDGIVIAQANEVTDELPRVDIPGSWVDFVVPADRPFAIEPLFTRDPRLITDVQVFMAMLALRGVYEKHQVTSLNHGIGFDTAAIELLLPTYGRQLGLKGRIATHWALNPHPTLIPAIESGWVESIMPFGGELGMERYAAARPDIFPVGADGTMRSSRMAAQTVGLYATDMFIGSSLHVDGDANSSTVTSGRLAGFGGAPNLGHSPGGRRHGSAAWQSLASGSGSAQRGGKLVVQILETFGTGGVPRFVDELDAVAAGEQAGLDGAPVMIYGEDVTHLVTEEGVACLYRARDQQERRAAVAAVAGVTPLGRRQEPATTQQLRDEGVVSLPEDLGVRRSEANRSLLAAHNIEELVAWSGGLYEPPARYRSW